VRLASMIHAPSLRALRLALWDPMRLAPFKTTLKRIEWD